MTSRRMITSDTWEDDFFTSLDFFERLLWFGILTGCADDQGRLQDNAVLIRSKVFPVDDVSIKQIEQALNRYTDASKITRYIANGKRLIQIVNWWKHQTPRWAGKSNYPPPTGWIDKERYHAAGNEIVTKNWDARGGYIAGNTTNDVNGDVKGDGEIDVEGDGGKPSTPPSAYSDDPTLESIYRAVTSQITLPSTTRENALTALRAILAEKKDKNAAIVYLQPFWREWKDVRHYQQTNTVWLTDWAVSGEVPTKKDTQPPAGQPHRKKYIGPNGEVSYMEG